MRTYPFIYTINHIQKINTTTIKERLSRKPHDLFSPHRTDFFMIYLFTEGEGKHIVDFEEIEVKPNHILFISKGQVHAFDPKESYDGRALIFTEDFFCRISHDCQFLQSTILFKNIFHQAFFDVKNNFDKLYDLFIEIFNELKNPVDHKQSEILHNLLYRILLLSEREIEFQEGFEKTQSLQHNIVLSFIQSVEENYKQQKKLVFYTDLLRVGIRSLQIATAKELNKTPKDIINDRVILEAKRKLTYENILIKEIAYDLGFEETTNFIKFFKLKTGLTPNEFKDSI